jgi:dTDP-4-dehydrorhamnose 3,5-epimerase
VKFNLTSLKGVVLIELDPKQDQRGMFVRTYCESEFKAQGLNTYWPQCNLTTTLHKGTIRGLHLQRQPKPEVKLLRCDSGAIFDVVVDLRPESPTFGNWEGFVLSGKDSTALYIPTGFAHGFQCLEDDCRLFYQMSEFYFSEYSDGIRWNDPTLKISWPLSNPLVSERDANLRLFAP